MTKRRLGFLGAIVAIAITVTGCGAFQKATFSRSTVSGNTLKSELFEIQAEMGSDWEFATDSDIAKLNDMSGCPAQALRILTRQSRKTKFFMMFCAESQPVQISLLPYLIRM